MDRKELKKNKKKRKRNRIILVFMSLILILFGIGAYLFSQTYQTANQTYDDLGRDKSDLREEEVSISNDPVSILLMGIENYSSDDQGGRSDTIMVATFNPEDEHLKLLSIPRDSLVEIPGRENEDKINHSYAYGGKELTIKTVENFLDIPIDYYATINFESFKNVVDTVGGITVDVPFDFQQNSDDRVAEKLQFYEGKMDLDGRYALAYARMRLEDPRGDIGRNERQKEVVEAVLEELTSLSSLTKIDDLAEDVANNVETNMKLLEGISFFKEYSDFRVDNIEQITIEGESEYIDNVSYYIPYEESIAEVQFELRSHLELD